MAKLTNSPTEKLRRKLFAGATIRRLREERDWTQLELARRLNISPSYLSQIEASQRSLSGTMVVDLARVFRVNLSIFTDDLGDRLAANLRETLADPLFAAIEVNPRELRTAAVQMPQIGRALLDLHAQYQSAERMAAARLAAARARQQAARLKMDKTAVLAPDDGLISARRATVGSLTQSGEELFRLIRGGRLEWRAEVPSADLLRVPVGTPAHLTGPNGGTVSGTVRAVAPSVDAQTRNGLIYVDLPPTEAVRAGMFARGEFELGRTPALSLPQTAVVLREGFAYVFRLEGEDRVAQTKVELGRRLGERVEIVAGLLPEARVVETGAGFLADGDVVRVVDGKAP